MTKESDMDALPIDKRPEFLASFLCNVTFGTDWPNPNVSAMIHRVLMLSLNSKVRHEYKKITHAYNYGGSSHGPRRAAGDHRSGSSTGTIPSPDGD